MIAAKILVFILGLLSVSPVGAYPVLDGQITAADITVVDDEMIIQTDATAGEIDVVDDVTVVDVDILEYDVKDQSCTDDALTLIEQLQGTLEEIAQINKLETQQEEETEEVLSLTLAQWKELVVPVCLVVLTVIMMTLCVPVTMILCLRIRKLRRLERRREQMMKRDHKNSGVQKIPSKFFYKGMEVVKKGAEMATVGLENNMVKK